MGCGMSTVDREGATLSSRRHKVVRPVSDNNLATKKLLDNGFDESVNSSAQQSRRSVSSQGKDEKMKEKERAIENGVKEAAEKEQGGNGEGEKNEEKEEEAYDREYLVVPRSPSFREYCIDSNSGDQSFREHFNDTESGESTKNEGDEGSAKRNNKPEELIKSDKDPKKKERKGLGFRNVIHKAMPRGKKHLLNFGCYTSHASYDDSTLNKVVGRAA